MLSYPTATTREEKMNIIHQIKDRLLQLHGDNILAIGLYGSIAQGIDGPYSDIELQVVTQDGVSLPGHEFIYPPFKIEIGMEQKRDIFKDAASVDDSWAITAGAYVHLQEIYDPANLLAEIRKLPLQVSDEAIKETMREFMIWEPYETMGKIRNNVQSGNLGYLPLGAKDLTWQTAKLIGLANRTFYNTRAKTLEESLSLKSRPSGYDELAQLVMRGQLLQIDHVYELCEQLWTGLNAWYEKMNIEYKSKELPF